MVYVLKKYKILFSLRFKDSWTPPTRKRLPKILNIVLNGSDFHHLQLFDSILGVKELITDGGLLASLEENQR